MIGLFLSSFPNRESDPAIMVATASSLPFGIRLEEFELTGVLGEGGFSVVYVALDHSLERTVAIKEYMPSAIATRQSDGKVLPKSPHHEDAFKAGLASFINEARLLARFNHPALIHIHRVWEQNGTAYMAMQYCLGKTLRQISQTDPTLVKNEGWLKATFTLILNALELLHAHNCFHRDISPDNILLLENGAPILLDFGAARQVIGDMTQALTVILKPGFAPIEQYADDPSLEQGAWTDVYGVGAVLYFLLMGKPPVASVARLVKDPMTKLADTDSLDWVSPSFRNAIDRALVVHPDQRIRTIGQLSDALQLPTFKPESQFGGALPAPPAVVPKTVSNKNPFPAESQSRPSPKNKVIQCPPTFTGITSSAPGSIHAKAPAVPINANSQQKQASSTKRHFLIFIGFIGVVILLVFVATIGLIVKPGYYLNDFKNIVAKISRTRTSPVPTILATPASSPELPSKNSSNDTVQKTLPETSDIPSSGAKFAAQATSEESESLTGVSAPNVGPEKEALSEQPSAITTKQPPLTKSVSSLGVPDSMTALATRPRLPASSGATDVMTGDQPPEAVTPTIPTVQAAASEQQKSAHSRKIVQAQPTPPVNNVSDRQLSSISEQPASASQALTSTIHFSIRPWGNVTVDGQKKGSSPPLVHILVPPGNHTIIITNSDFPPVTKQIIVSDKGDVVVAHRFGDE